MYHEGQRIKQKNGLILVIKKVLTNWSYIIDMKKVNEKGKILAKGVKLVEGDDLKEGKISFFIDKNIEKKETKPNKKPLLKKKVE